MEEILKSLIASSGNKETVNRQCYFNLRSTFRSWNEPTQFQILKQLKKGAKYLQKSYDHHNGFQSATSQNIKLYPDVDSVSPDTAHNKEILTSIIALDVLQYNNDNTINLSVDSKLEASKDSDRPLLTSDRVCKIIEFITPVSGLMLFNLYQDDLVEDEKNHDDSKKSANNAITSLAIAVLLENGNLNIEPAKIVAKLLKEEILARFDSHLQDESALENEDIDIDPIECCNLMRLLYQLDLADGTEDIEDYLYSYLEHKLYLSENPEHLVNKDQDNCGGGEIHLTFSGDIFLYFLTRAVVLCPQAERKFKHLLWDRVVDRLGSGLSFNCYPNSESFDNPQHFSPINIAFRILTLTKLSSFMSIPTVQRQSAQRSVLLGEMKDLLQCQCDDGSFPPDALCTINQQMFFGGPQITTLVTLQALQSTIIHDQRYQHNHLA